MKVSSVTITAPQAPTAPPAEQRGRLDIAPAVIERIAEVAAGEIDGVQSRRSGGLGRTARGTRARADVDGRVARLRIAVALRYPIAVRPACEQIRQAVVSRVYELAGVTVTGCDLRVVELRAEYEERRVL